MTSPIKHRSPLEMPPLGAPPRGGPTDPSHDADLRRGVLRTDVRRPVAGLLVAIFLAAIYAVPIVQAIEDKRNGEESMLPDLFARWPTKDSIRQFEEDLEKASGPREWVRPRLQLAFTQLGGFGNTKAVVGRERGWLFYQPGVVSVGGPGLLDASILESRAKGARDAGEPALFPDPRPAILEFHRYLAARGIALVVFPVPDKATLQPVELRGHRTSDARGIPAANPDQERLARELSGAGVLVFDPTPARLYPGEPPRFMAQDTHWTPAWMEEVAGELARFLRQRVLGTRVEAARPWAVTDKTVARVGDLVDMLGLPGGQTLFAPQAMALHQVTAADGTPFEPNAHAGVLLLGDSFSNVFTLGQMGWGEAAGLAPHLARALGEDVDVIAQNDAGAYATRKLLRNELPAEGDSAAAAGTADEARAQPASGQEPDRLAGKKVVVWEFAARELAVGNWKPIAWPKVAVAGGRKTEAQGADGRARP